MKVLVSGGAGFIGSHLVDYLVEEGHQVVVIDNLYRGKLENISIHIQNNSINWQQVDIRNYEEIESLFNGCEIVFHLAAQSNVMGAVVNLDYSFETNVIGTYNMLKASKKAGIKRFIFLSSREAYGEAQYLPVDEGHPLRSKNSYGASKVAGEKYCEIFQNMEYLEIAILRLSNVYGHRDFDRVIPIFINNANQKQNIHIFGGKQVIDFISIELVIEALVQAMHNKHIIKMPTNIGSGVGTSLIELANRIKDQTKSDIRIILDPPRSVEVVKFTANINRFNEIFNINIPSDPLYYLDKMISD